MVTWSKRTCLSQILMLLDFHKHLLAQHGSQMELKFLNSMGCEISMGGYPSAKAKQMVRMQKSMKMTTILMAHGRIMT